MHPPPSSDTGTVIGVYETHEAAENVIRALSHGGFDMLKLSIVGKGYRSEERPLGFYVVGDRVKVWGGIGSFWGAICGLLTSTAVLLVPPVGLLVAAGPFVTTLVSALEGAAVFGGVSALAAALVSVGSSKDQSIKYEADIKADRFLLMVHGSDADKAKARHIIACMPHFVVVTAGE